MIRLLESEVRNAKNIVVAFTGVRHGMGGIPFDFYKSLGQLDCAALFINDLGCRWYQYDISEIVATANRIDEVVRSSGADRSIFLGNSMGGFGSLLFGKLCNADSILSFAPQTAIDPVVTKTLGDERWIEYQSLILEYPYGDVSVLTPPTGRIVLCYGSADPLDAAHVRHLAARWPFEEMVIPNAGHDVAAHLKERKELLPLIAKELV